MNEATFKQLSPKQQSMVIEMFKGLRREIQQWKNPATDMKNYYKEMDKDIEKGKFGRESSCRKGCSFCCNINVDVSKPESDLLKEHVRPEDVPTLLKQAVSPKEFHELDYVDRKCIFLENGECRVYDIRPMSCRKYFVKSDPEKCNSEFENHEVIVIAGTIPSLRSEALWSLYPTKNLASQLLNL